MTKRLFCEILTKQEQKVLDRIIKVWNSYLELPNEHPDHDQEFRSKIHDLQRMIAARPAMRYINSKTEKCQKNNSN